MTVFENENEQMRPAAIKALAEWYPADTYVTEYRHNNGKSDPGRRYADLLVLQTDQHRLQERIDRTGNPPAAVNRLYHNQLQERSPTAPEGLLDFDYRCPFEETPAGRRLDYLLRHGYASRSNGRVEAVESPNILSSVVSFELKRFDAETAIEQACDRLGTVADTSYVVMDAGHTGAATKRREQFEQSGIGLCSLDEEGLDLIYPATGSADRDRHERLEELAYLGHVKRERGPDAGTVPDYISGHFDTVGVFDPE